MTLNNNTKRFDLIQTNLNKYAPEYLLSLLVFMNAVFLLVNGFVRMVIPNTYKLDTLLMYTVILVLALYALPIIARSITSRQIIVFSVVTVIVLMGMMFAKDSELYLQVIGKIFWPCIPSFLSAMAVRDYSRLRKILVVYATVIPPFFALFIAVSANNLLADTANYYSQFYSYMLLLPGVILASEMLRKFKIISLISFITAVLLMLSFGARGPLVCLVAYVAWAIIRNLSSQNMKKRLFFALVVIILAAVFTMYFYNILNWLMDLFSELGMSVRTIQYLLNGEMLEDEARDSIAQFVWQQTLDHPFFGVGPINDRQIIHDYLLPTESAIGTYPHNFFLEIWMQFGLLFGTIINGSFLVMVGKCMLGKRFSEEKELVAIFFAAGFLPLLFSSSYIQDSLFYVFLGICSAVSRRMKRGEDLPVKENINEEINY